MNATTDVPWDDGSIAVEQIKAGDLLDQFVAATERKRKLEADLRVVKDEITPLTEQLLEQFAEEGVSGKRHAATGRLVSITRKVWARAAGGDKTAASAALKKAGLGDYVEESFNTNSLSAYFREQVKARESEGQPVTDLTELLDPALRGAIELTEDHTLSVRV